MKHDSFFSKVVFEKCIQKVIAQGVSVLHIFSDGCSSQYKSRYTFKHLSDLQAKYPSVRLTRHVLEQVTENHCVILLVVW